MRALDLTGQRFGALTVIERAGSYMHETAQFATWLCRCDCGNEKIVIGTNLRAGHTKSCGCQIWRKHESKT